MDELKKSLENAILKRFDSPLFGFIFLSWLATNWSNIFFLFLSKRTIEERIHALTNLSLVDYLQYLFLPIFIGIALAIIYPYAQIWLENLQRKAIKIRVEEDKARSKVAYEMVIELSDLKARAESATEDANKKIQNEKEIIQKKQDVEIELIEIKKLADEEVINQEKETKIKNEQEQQLIVSSRIDELVKGVADLKSELSRLDSSVNYKKRELEGVNKEYDLTVSSLLQVIEKVKSYNTISNSKGLHDVTKEIVNIINNRMSGFKGISEMTGAEITNLINSDKDLRIIGKSKDINEIKR